MGRLTTHVLDTARGKPAAHLEIDLIRIKGETQTVLKTVLTNADGRCDAPLLEGDALERGRYELVFHAASYLREMGDDLPEFPFLDDIVIAFGIDRDDQHYHVPLLLSAYGYSTYRGS
ncbi:hydroxyisourate hydrolase [Candidatus Puniceispirillum marinum]|uniref:5-hydroxyisourate hydrolase n=1 Tax=Puniceispirillum marinum (strain IMCC1322) TaxID=488538 RepID=D5BTM7_PUNMI|nr:hydroxyisourate hydrolase [Candidatus Puniceispirillum marinum]ADE39624.1 Transthyretin [Candidatus Puniceispirillum marinum IMCC1322]